MKIIDKTKIEIKDEALRKIIEKKKTIKKTIRIKIDTHMQCQKTAEKNYQQK
jgi:hypothetical protein